MDYSFRRAAFDDINAVFTLYEERVKWMDRQGIEQWNVTSYLDAYPIEYYEKERRLGNLYVLTEEHRIVGAVVLLQSDDRWPDRANSFAYYIHNLVTDCAAPGAGKRILEEVEKLAIQQGKQYLRLDCAADNKFLNQYYESQGYVLTGRCRDGDYAGNRREKMLPDNQRIGVSVSYSHDKLLKSKKSLDVPSEP